MTREERIELFKFGCETDAISLKERPKNPYLIDLNQVNQNALSIIQELQSDLKNSEALIKEATRANAVFKEKNQQLRERLESWQEYQDDCFRLRREMDVAINGKNGATQASACDIVAQLNGFVRKGGKCIFDFYAVHLNKGEVSNG